MAHLARTPRLGGCRGSLNIPGPSVAFTFHEARAQRGHIVRSIATVISGTWTSSDHRETLRLSACSTLALRTDRTGQALGKGPECCERSPHSQETMDEPSPPSYQGPTSLMAIVVSRLLNIAASACSPKLAIRSRPTQTDSFFADRTGSPVVSGPSPLLGQRSTAQHSMLWTTATQPRISHYCPWALSCP